VYVWKHGLLPVQVVPSLVESGTVVQLPETHAAFLQGSVLAGHAVPQLRQLVVVLRLTQVLPQQPGVALPATQQVVPA